MSVLVFILLDALIFAYLTKKLIIGKFETVYKKLLYHLIENTF